MKLATIAAVSENYSMAISCGGDCNVTLLLIVRVKTLNMIHRTVINTQMKIVHLNLHLVDSARKNVL